MRRKIFCLLMSVFFVFLFAGAFSEEGIAQPKQITLKMVQVFPKGQANMLVVSPFIEKVHKLSKGELQIKLLGGPEAIPTFDQWEALKSGVVDLNFNVTAYYYRKAVPESMTMWLSKCESPAEERKNGFYDLLNDLHKEVGVYYLGRGQWSSFYLWPTKKVESPRELSGMKFRSGLLYDSFLKALGAAPVTIPQPEVYTALERKMVDGFGWPMEGVAVSGWPEVTKYCIDHPFYQGDFLFLANLKSFNNLPKHLQTILTEAAREFEPEMVEFFKQMLKEEREKVVKAGVNFIKFSPEDAKRYVDLAWQAGYNEAKQICRPQYFEKIMKMACW